MYLNLSVYFSVSVSLRLSICISMSPSIYLYLYPYRAVRASIAPSLRHSARRVSTIQDKQMNEWRDKSRRTTR